MKQFSFFYAAGTAGYVRGKQIADYLGGKKNPKSGFENDICIYVKIIPPENAPKNTYLDVDDSTRAAEYLKSHPKLGVIATSETARKYLSKSLNRKDIIVIPHAHCNYEKWIRPDREVENVGIIGSKTSFQFSIETFREELKKIELNLLYEKNYWETYQNNKLKVCEFYKQIDVQVVWRPKMYATQFKNPNKLINAGSFGIPTIAWPEDSFVEEWGGHFIPVDRIDKMVLFLEFFKNSKSFYKKMSEIALERAEKCHIYEISKLYLEL